MIEGDYSKQIARENFETMTREQIIEDFTLLLDKALSLPTKKNRCVLCYSVGMHPSPNVVIGTSRRMDTPGYMMMLAQLISIPLLHGDITPEDVQDILIPTALAFAKFHASGT